MTTKMDPPETRREEHARLQHRTDELKDDHAALDRDLTPFNKGDHDQHSENLRKHKTDLAEHQQRYADTDLRLDEPISARAPLFADRLPFAQLLAQERQESMRRAHEGLYHWLGHYQQMMLLEAAIIGVVIPLLYAQGPSLVNPWFLRRAVAWLGSSMFVGVLIAGVSKWAIVLILTRIQQQYARQDEAIAAGADESGVSANLHEANEAFRPEARKLLRLVYSGIIGDVFFYGPFLLGIYYLLSGFLRA